MWYFTLQAELQHIRPHSLTLLFSVRLVGCGFIHGLLQPCLFVPCHYPKGFYLSLLHLVHNARFFLLFLAAFPCCPSTASTVYVVLPSQLPAPSQTLFSSPVIIILATLTMSLPLASGSCWGCHPGTCISTTSTDPIQFIFCLKCTNSQTLSHDTQHTEPI